MLARIIISGGVGQKIACIPVLKFVTIVKLFHYDQ